MVLVITLRKDLYDTQEDPILARLPPNGAISRLDTVAMYIVMLVIIVIGSAQKTRDFAP